MAKLKHVVRQATVIPAVTGTGAGVVQAAGELNPGKTMEMVPKSTMNEFGDTVKTHVATWVSPETQSAADTFSEALATGGKVAAGTALGVLAYHGIKHLINNTQFGKHL